MDFIWNDGLDLSTLLSVGTKPWQVMAGFCNNLLGNRALFSRLKAEQFDVALVDLIYNECGLALVGQLGVPSVGYWAFSFSNGEAEMTTVATPPSHVPTFMSCLSHEMNFAERLKNFAYKVFARSLMWVQTLYCDSIVRQYYPDSPSTQTLLGDLSGALLNTDNILDYPRLQPETFVNIGGMQINEKPKPLPQVMQSLRIKFTSSREAHCQP